jgi:hypothetical protein
MKIDVWSLPSFDLEFTPSKDIGIGKESRVAKGATVNNTSDCHEFNPVLEGINLLEVKPRCRSSFIACEVRL